MKAALSLAVEEVVVVVGVFWPFMMQCDQEQVRAGQELEFNDIALYLEAIVAD